MAAMSQSNLSASEADAEADFKLGAMNRGQLLELSGGSIKSPLALPSPPPRNV